jgi:hypothetical protein
MQASFGDDPVQYENRSPINHIRAGVRVPVFVVIAEYENPGIDVRGGELLCANATASARASCGSVATITCRKCSRSIRPTNTSVAKSSISSPAGGRFATLAKPCGSHQAPPRRQLCVKNDAFGIFVIGSDGALKTDSKRTLRHFAFGPNRRHCLPSNQHNRRPPGCGPS